MKAGIDLGTSYSLIAKVTAAGQSELIPDATFKSKISTPSVIHLAEKKALIGWQALQYQELYPNDTQLLSFFKKDMGIEEPYTYDEKGNPWYPEGLSALLLKKLKSDCEIYSGQFLDGAVITVPAHFNDTQRRAIIYAAHLADIPLLEMIDEPIAAAIHYGLHANTEKERVLFVYDFGGGTFDATILTINDKGIYVLSKDGNTNLGGKNIDDIIKQLILPQISDNQPFENWNAFNWLQLQKIAEELKMEFSLSNARFIQKEILIGNQIHPILLSQSQFEHNIENILHKTIECSKRCIEQSGLKVNDIDDFIFVGGSSQIPKVQQFFCKEMGVEASKTKSHLPMIAVAHGAALFAAKLAGDGSDHNLPPEFKGVSGYYLGIKTIDPKTKKVMIDTLLQKNLPLPLKAIKTYFTSNQLQDKIVLDVVQYTESDASDASSIGRVIIGPIEKPQVNYPIEVNLEIGTNGCVTVKTFDPLTRNEVRNTFSPEVSFSSTMLQQKQLILQTVIN